MKRYRSVARTPIDLADGRTLAPGESAELDAGAPHNAALIADGRLLEEAAPSAKRPGAKTPEEAS